MLIILLLFSIQHGQRHWKNIKTYSTKLSNPSIQAPLLSYSASQTSSYIESTSTSVPSITVEKQTNSVLCSENSTQNNSSIRNNDNIKSCETRRTKIYIIPTTSTTNHYTQRIFYKSVNLLSIYTTTKLPTVGTEYMCFQNDGKTSQESKWIKSRIMNKVIDSVI